MLGRTTCSVVMVLCITNRGSRYASSRNSKCQDVFREIETLGRLGQPTIVGQVGYGLRLRRYIKKVATNTKMAMGIPIRVHVRAPLLASVKCSTWEGAGRVVGASSSGIRPRWGSAVDLKVGDAAGFEGVGP